MATFNEYLQQNASRQDPVGQIGLFWKSLDNKPRAHAPTGVENHLKRLGDEVYTPELKRAFAIALDEYRNLRAAPGTKLDGPENVIITLGAIHQALTAINLAQNQLWTRMQAIGLKVGCDFTDEPLAAVQPLPPPPGRAGDQVQADPERAESDSEPISGLDWGAVWQQADFAAPGDAQEAA